VWQALYKASIAGSAIEAIKLGHTQDVAAVAEAELRRLRPSVLRAHQSRWPPFWRTCRGYWQLSLANATVASGAGVGDGVACHWPAWT
jgi:hypothetical protein